MTLGVVSAAPKSEKTMIDPECVVLDAAFMVRQGARDRAHIRTLASVPGAGRPLDPILVWRDSERQANALVLLDGAYRLAAYRSAGWSGPVPAVIVECTRKEAFLRTARANSKDRKPLNQQEKQDYAWRLVRDETVRFSRPELAAATGVSESSIARMRRRWAILRERPDGNLSGNWWRDQKDRSEDGEEGPPLSDAARTAAIEEKIRALRDFFDWRKGDPILRDETARYEIVIGALGHPAIRSIADYALGGRDEADAWLGREITPVGEFSHIDLLTAEMRTDDEDENPDF